MKQEKGASFVEFAIVLPVFAVIAIGVLEFSRYWHAKNILDTSANQALAKAVVVTGIDDLSNGEASASANRATQKIREAAQDIWSSFYQADESSGTNAYLTDPNETGAPIQITFPAPSPGLDIGDDKLVQVSMQAELKPLIPLFSTFQLNASASGFIESKNNLSYPVASDCAGLHVSHWAYNPVENCECIANGASFENEACNCSLVTCPPGRFPLESLNCGCSCPIGTVEDAAGDCSGCPTADNGVPRIIRKGQCKCDLPADHCGPGFVLDQNLCECKCETQCPDGHLQDPATCGCSCDTSPSSNYEATHGGCSCRSDLPPCPGALVRDPDNNCECGCPGDGSMVVDDPVAGTCTCREDLIIQHPTEARCLCNRYNPSPSVECQEVMCQICGGVWNALNSTCTGCFDE